EVVEEWREGHRGVESPVGRVATDVKEVHVFRHPHVRDDQAQSRITLQQKPYRLRTGVLARCRPGTTMDDNRDPGIFDRAPDRIEKRVVGLVSAYLHMRFEDLRSVTDCGLDV